MAPGKQEVEIIIKPDGTVEEQVIGVSGPDCEKLTRSIEDALGDVIERERTADYYDNQEESGDTVSTSW
ncbi:MAG: DUF2997 domain-containing protein [Chloroflexi bacterium]|nr:DUF2997 domain-containing protein [Chloroflexota bacterium]